MTALLLQSPANANPEVNSHKHCVARPDSYEVAGVVHRISGAGLVGCFPTFADAIAFATDYLVIFPKDVTRETVERELDLRLLAARASARIEHPDNNPGGDVPIGIDYDTDFFDEELIWQVNTVDGCATGATFEAHAMPSGWNDKVDKATAKSGCNDWPHFEHNDYGGAVQKCTCATMDAMEDETSSEKWSRGTQQVFDALFLIESAVDPSTCPILASLTPGIPGVVDINPEGDMWVLGEQVEDCPPYQVFRR